MTLERLKVLSLRVIAVQLMISQNNFGKTFRTLMNDYEIDQDLAFKISVRVYRGGGFTKDFLYLRGVKDALKLRLNESLNNLYIGKTSFKYLKTINEMVERQIISKPKFFPTHLKKKMKIKSNPILDYLMHSAM